MSKIVLITGATGNQGRSVISALLALPPSPPFTIFALTRKPTSAAAIRLAEKSSSIKLIAGNLDNPSAIFASIPVPVWGVFSVQTRKGSSPEIEERQSKALIDAALQRNVQHFVYSSVDRHGARSDTDATNVLHFANKHRCEKYLQEKSVGGRMTWTILRPVCFMENLSPDFKGKAFASMWESELAARKPLQLVAAADIGFFAAQAFLRPEEYKDRMLSLAGDELTFGQAQNVFKEKTGRELPTTFGIVSWGLRNGVRELRLMFTWFAEVGYAANVVELRKMHPQLLSFGDWLERESAFLE